MHSGKYITFIDSDDYIEKDYIEYLYRLLLKYNLKISVCSYSILIENKKTIDIGKKYKEEVITKIEALERMLDERGFSVSSCAKLYHIELWKDIRFPIGKLNEDNGTTYKLIDKVENVVYGNKSKYYYFKRKNSIMMSVFNEKKLNMIELTDEMCDNLEHKYPELRDSLDRRRTYARFNILRQMVQVKDLCDFQKEKEKDIIDWIKQRKKRIFKNPKSSKRDKVALICLMIGKNFFKFMWNFYERIKY